MSSYKKIKKTSTIKELIIAGKHQRYTSDKLHLKETFTKSDGTVIVFNIYSLLDRYMDDLQSYIETIELTDKEYLKYRFQPKRLCVDIYDCIDMAPLILKINNMLSLLDFDKQTIKLFRPSVISVLNEIIVLEKDQYDLNESNVNKKINETK